MMGVVNPNPKSPASAEPLITYNMQALHVQSDGSPNWIVGQRIDYFSMSHRAWIGGVVKQVRANKVLTLSGFGDGLDRHGVAGDTTKRVQPCARAPIVTLQNPVEALPTPIKYNDPRICQWPAEMPIVMSGSKILSRQNCDILQDEVSQS